MPKITLAAKEQRTIPTSMRFMSVINASRAFFVEAPEIGRLVGETGRQYELDNIRSITLVNDDNTSVDIEYELANIKVHTSGKGVVSVNNEVVVKRIVEAIQVNANATVDNGKMATLPANNSAHNEITLNAGETKLLLSARAADNRTVAVQVLSQNPTQVCVGSVAAMSEKSGVVLQGSIAAIASLERQTTQAIYVRNNSADIATVTGFEEWRE